MLFRSGTLALMDTDDSFFTMDPKDTQLEDMLSDARVKQAQLNGDRNIGRKLPVLLTSAGLSIIGCRARIFTSFEIPFEIIFRLATGFKAALLDRRNEFTEIMNRLSPQFKCGRAFMTCGVIIAGGKKIDNQ